MPDEGGHAACVSTWLTRTAGDRSPKVVLRLFEASLGALWTLAAATLGEITLAAIADRILHTASEKFPFLQSITVESTGISFHDFRERTSTLQDPELTEGIRFVLVEFLTVLGNLTAEILTPELHAELSNVASSETVSAKNGPPGNPAHTKGAESGRNGS